VPHNSSRSSKVQYEKSENEKDHVVAYACSHPYHRLPGITSTYSSSNNRYC